jgi:hypothetical protein
MSENVSILPPENEPLVKAMGRARSALTTMQDLLVVAHRQADDAEMVRQRIRYLMRLCEAAVKEVDLEGQACRRQN